MSSPFYVPIAPSLHTNVQPMYWVAGQWMVPSSHLAQVPVTTIPSSLPLGHTGHAIHPHRSGSSSAVHWPRHDLGSGQHREDVIPIPQIEAQAQRSSRSPGNSRQAPAPYHRPGRHSEPSTQHAKAVSREPIGHTQNSARMKSHREEQDQDYQPGPFSTRLDRNAARSASTPSTSRFREKEERVSSVTSDPTSCCHLLTLRSINAGVEALRQVLPGTNENDSKATLLDKAVQYILHLESLLRESRSCEGRAMGRGQSGKIDEVKTEVE